MVLSEFCTFYLARAMPIAYVASLFSTLSRSTAEDDSASTPRATSTSWDEAEIRATPAYQSAVRGSNVGHACSRDVCHMHRALREVPHV